MQRNKSKDLVKPASPSAVSRRSFLGAVVPAVATIGVVKAMPVSSAAAKQQADAQRLAELYERDVNRDPSNEWAVICGELFMYLLVQAEQDHDRTLRTVLGPEGFCRCPFSQNAFHVIPLLEAQLSLLSGNCFGSRRIDLARKGKYGPAIPANLPSEERALIAGHHFQEALDQCFQVHGGRYCCGFCEETTHVEYALDIYLDVLSSELPYSPERMRLDSVLDGVEDAECLTQESWALWLKSGRAEHMKEHLAKS